MVEDILADFKGTLLSDFYTAYNPLPYAKQKCIVHLFRRLEKALKEEDEAGGHDKELGGFISEVVKLFQGVIKEAKERERRNKEREKKVTGQRKEGGPQGLGNGRRETRRRSGS